MAPCVAEGRGKFDDSGRSVGVGVGLGWAENMAPCVGDLHLYWMLSPPVAAGMPLLFPQVYLHQHKSAETHMQVAGLQRGNGNYFPFSTQASQSTPACHHSVKPSPFWCSGGDHPIGLLMY